MFNLIYNQVRELRGDKKGIGNPENRSLQFSLNTNGVLMWIFKIISQSYIDSYSTRKPNVIRESAF